VPVYCVNKVYIYISFVYLVQGSYVYGLQD
jgi:hypothetical protein